MRRPCAAVLGILLAVAVPALAACLGGQASGLTSAGRACLGVDGSIVTIDRDRLTDVGRPDRVNTPGTDGRVCILPGLPDLCPYRADPIRDGCATR